MAVPKTIHSPPGRAGRLWLRDRLALAERAVYLLDRKVRLLRREFDRVDEAATRATADWQSACRQAREWERRAVIGGGARSLQLNTPVEGADVMLGSTSVMGIHFPDSARCRVPERAPERALIGSSAISPAAVAFGRAVQLGADCAVSVAAREALAAEIAATSQRLRALRDRWIPALQASLRAIEAALDELERSDSARLRWASTSGVGGSRPGAGQRRVPVPGVVNADASLPGGETKCRPRPV